MKLGQKMTLSRIQRNYAHEQDEMTIAALSIATSLGDKEIRQLLIRRLENASRIPKAILEELRVHNGNAIAGVVSVHCHFFIDLNGLIA